MVKLRKQKPCISDNSMKFTNFLDKKHLNLLNVTFSVYPNKTSTDCRYLTSNPLTTVTLFRILTCLKKRVCKGMLGK